MPLGDTLEIFERSSFFELDKLSLCGQNPDHFWIVGSKLRSPGFDRIASVLAGLFVIGLAAFLLIRNEPIASTQLFFILRVLLSFAVATLAATIPGFLNVSWSGSGLLIRAGGALAVFLLTYVYTPSVLPDPNNRSCRDPSHGVESYKRTFPSTMTSPEMGGGHSQDEWCNNAIGTLSGQYPGGHFSVLSKGESQKNHCWPSNCPQYTYTCSIQVQAEPIYKIAVSPECR